MDRKRLVIVADDLGWNAQRSHGIFLCYEQSVLRSAGVIATMADGARAAKHAREKGLSCGIHLNLTEESPLSKPGDIATLVDAQGNFHGLAGLRRLLDDGAVERAHLEREIRAQVEWMFDHYGYPSHVSAHGHVHLHPAVMPVVVEAMERYSIRFVRIPEELPLPPFGYVVPEEQLADVAILNAEARAARQLLAGTTVEALNHFRGSTLLGNASKKNLRHILARLPEGATELMVHPSSPCSYGTAFDLDPQRVTELQMLLDPELPTLLAERKIEVVSYADL